MTLTLLNANTTSEGLSADNVLSEIRSMSGKLALIRDSNKLVAMCADPAVQIQTVFRGAGDGTIDQDATAFVNSRINAAPQASWIHLTNEVGFSAALDTWTRSATLAAEARGYKVVAYNAATNQSLAQWQSAQSTIAWLLGRGHKIGLHIYLDSVHDAGAIAPLDWLLSIGVVPFVTEFGYIVSIFDANTGWRKGLSNNPALLNGWLDTKMALFASKGAPLFMFSESNWQTDTYGKQNGFGYGDHPDVLAHCGTLNTRYPIGGTPVTPIPPLQFKPGIITWTADAKNGANVRAAATTAAPVLSVLHTGDSVAYSLPAVPGGVYSVGGVNYTDWIRLQAGFVANGVIRIEAAAPVPPKPEALFDVSEAQGVLTAAFWQDAVAQGKTGVIIRSCQGSGQTDSQFANNVTGALAVGLKIGTYSAMIASQSGASQAAHYLDVVAPYRAKLSYPLCIDAELVNGQTPAAIADTLYQFAQALEGAVGSKPRIYTSNGFMAGVGTQHDAYLATCECWVANWTTAATPLLPRPWTTWALWQYANDGSIGGKRVDLSRTPS